MKQGIKARSFRPQVIKRAFTLLKENWMNLIRKEELGRVENTHERTEIGFS